MITLGANVNTASHYTRRTPLMAAVALGHLSVASLLIDKGCSVNATDINGLNVLHYAVDSNNLDSVEFVLKQGLHVDAQDSSGWTPLMRAGDSHVTRTSKTYFFLQPSCPVATKSSTYCCKMAPPSPSKTRTASTSTNIENWRGCESKSGQKYCTIYLKAKIKKCSVVLFYLRSPDVFLWRLQNVPLLYC